MRREHRIELAGGGQFAYANTQKQVARDQHEREPDQDRELDSTGETNSPNDQRRDEKDSQRGKEIRVRKKNLV